MNKNDLIAAVAEMNDGMTKTQIKATLDATIETISDTLASGEDVDLFGFGKFSVGTRAARTGRSPQTGESLEIPESKVVKFKPAKALKTSVQ